MDERNCLVLNPKKGKTEFVMFAARVRNEPVKVTIDENGTNQPHMYEYLGVKLDSHLNMNFHFEQNIYKRVSSRIKLLKRVRHQMVAIFASVDNRSLPGVVLGVQDHKKIKFPMVSILANGT